MSDGTILTIKRPITVRAVVTPTWKEEAEREKLRDAFLEKARARKVDKDVLRSARRKARRKTHPDFGVKG